MPETLPDVDILSTIDRALLTEAGALLGGLPAAETVNQALGVLIRELRRTAAVEHEARRLEAGAYGPVGGAEGRR